MTFFKKSEIKNYADRKIRSRSFTAASTILRESELLHTNGKSYDIFLSHSSKDADIVLGVKAFLEDQGYAVYVDWLEDTQLDRTRVTPETADILRSRMRVCSSLIFVATENASSSKWMPWELGYFDGYRENMISIFPVLEDWKNTFDGQEYLGLYPVVEAVHTNYGKSYIVRRKSSSRSTDLSKFVKGQAII